jgi:hypothetical protein
VSTLSRVIFDPDTTPPTIPLSVVATALSQTTIRITWAASTDTGGAGLSGYRVVRSTTSGGVYAQIGGDLSVASLSFDDTSLTASTTRFYRVLSFDGTGNQSALSVIVSATTQAAGTTIARLPFADGFETGSTSAWDATAGSMPVTTAEAYLGTRSSMITAVGGGTPNDNYLDYNFGDALSVGGTATGTNDLWIRVAHKWSSNWLDNGYASVQKVFLLNIHNPTTGARRYQLTFNIWTPDLGYFCEFLRWQEAGPANGNATPNIGLGLARVLGQWVEFVFQVRMNSLGVSDGILRIWSKSQGATSYVQRVNRGDINYRDSETFSPNRLIQSNYQPDGTPSGTRYWDAWLLQQTAIDVSGSGSGETVGSWAARDLTDQKIYRIDSSVGDMPVFVVEGATHTLEPTSGWDGGYSHKLTPIISGTPPATGQGAMSLGSFVFDQAGTLACRKLNVRFEVQFGSAWGTNLVNQIKWIIVHSSTTQTGSFPTQERPMYYIANMGSEAGDAPVALQVDGLLAFGVASGTTKNFEPLQDGFAGYNWPRGNEDFLWGPSATTISGKRIVPLTDWYTIELEMIAQSTALWAGAPAPPSGAANGLIRGVITNRAGEVLTDLYVPWNWDSSWTVDDFIREVQLIGGYGNATQTPGANNYMRLSAVTFSVNRAGLIGPRSGFVV